MVVISKIRVNIKTACNSWVRLLKHVIIYILLVYEIIIILNQTDSWTGDKKHLIYYYFYYNVIVRSKNEFNWAAVLDW